METEDILTRAKISPEAPPGWIVLRLLRDRVMRGIAGWIFGVIAGLGIFTVVALIVIPHNYQYGIVPALFTTLFLGLLLFIGLGSAWLLLVDVRRLREADKHLIIITPDDFVKQEGEKIIHVPLVHVQYVTARGVAPDRTPRRDSSGRPILRAAAADPSSRGAFIPFFQWRRKIARSPTSLAFVDTRTDTEVMVVTDEAFGDPSIIGTMLKQYAASVQTIV